MKTGNLHELIERVGNLLGAEERRKCMQVGLQPIQLHALHYLSRCNRYSDTPAAVTDYLGLTKGTVSQSLNELKKKGMIEKKADAKDRRVVHLKVTERGMDTLRQLIPPKLFASVVGNLEEQQSHELADLLTELLRLLQRANLAKSFGVCKSCRFFQSLDSGFRCGLTLETLQGGDIEKICREHESPESEHRDLMPPASIG